MYIKIGGEVINSRVSARTKLRVKSKVSCFEITYFSYAKHCRAAQRTPPKNEMQLKK